MTTIQVTMIATTILVVAYTAWKTGPSIFLLFRPTAISSHFLPSSDVEPQGETEDTRIKHWVQQLQALNFTYLGIKQETSPLWGKPVQEISFASQKDKVFASIYPVAGKREKRYNFYTPFTDGSIVLTANSGFMVKKTEGYCINVVSVDELEKSLELHKAEVQKFINKGHQPIQTYDQTTRIEATDVFYASEHTQEVVKARGRTLVFVLGCVLMLAIGVILNVLK